MLVGLDTNVLVYAEQVGDPARYAMANTLIGVLEPDECVLPVQVLGELYNVLTRKAGRTRAAAAEALQFWQGLFQTAYADEDVFRDALALAVDHRLQIWDAMILATSQAVGCEVFLSEDLQDGFIWRGMTVINPFAPEAADRLKGLLRGL